MTDETLSPFELNDRIEDIQEELYEENQLTMCEAGDSVNMARLNTELAELKKLRGDPVECFMLD